MANNHEHHQRSADTPPNSEQSSRVKVAFYGVIHEQLNLQMLDRFVPWMTQQLESANGPVILYLEQAAITQHDANVAKMEFNQPGGFADYVVKQTLRNQLRRNPSGMEIRKRKEEILQTKTMNDLIDQELLPNSKFLTFYLNHALDTLRAQRRFDFEFETHSGEIIKRQNSDMGQVARLQNQSKAAWENRDFDTVLQTTTTIPGILNRVDLLREPDIVQQEQKLIDRLYKTGGVLIPFFGEHHIHNIATLSKQLPEDLSVSIETNVPDIEFPMKNIMNHLRRNESVDDTTCARAFVMLHLITLLSNKNFEEGTLSEYVHKYEDYYSAAGAYAYSLSLEEIRRFCETGEPIPLPAL